MNRRVLILGSSHVGASLAGELVDQGCEVTVVCDQQASLQKLQQLLDIRTVFGNPSYPDILRLARADNMAVLIAVTPVDEVNMLACQVAYSLFKVPLKIARIRSRHYFYRNELFGNDNLPVDIFLDPERAVAHNLLHLINFVGVSSAFSFPDVGLVLLTVKIPSTGSWVEKSWQAFQKVVAEHMGMALAIQRAQRYINVMPSTLLQPQDACYIMVTEDAVCNLLLALDMQSKDKIRKVIIAGGGGVGEALAEHLIQAHCHVKIIDHDAELCQRLATHIPDATVLIGDASGRKLLFQENVEAVDAFIALTSDDEDNIISALQAKYLGAKHVLSLVNNSEYMEIFANSDVDVFVPPQQMTISEVLTIIRPDFVKQVFTLSRGKSEVLCCELLEGKAKRILGQSISALHLPDGVVFAGLYRGGTHCFDSRVELTYGDCVVFLLQDKHAYGAIALWFS